MQASLALACNEEWPGISRPFFFVISAAVSAIQ